MNKDNTIPKEEQLKALADGITSFYHLIEDYTKNPISTDFRNYATVTKAELAEYLRRNPESATRHIMSKCSALRLHDHPALIGEDGQWLVCWIDHGEMTNKNYYSDLCEAAANFIMAYW